MSSFPQRVCIIWVILATMDQVDSAKRLPGIEPGDGPTGLNRTTTKSNRSRHFWAALERFLNQYERSRGQAAQVVTEGPGNDLDNVDDDNEDDKDHVDQILTPTTVQKGTEAAMDKRPPLDVPSAANDVILDALWNDEQQQEYAGEAEVEGEPLTQVPSHHPYMQTIYEEIEERRHQKWSEIETDSAKIRGIEPFNIIQEKGRDSAVLEFSTATLHSLKHIRHVDLILTTNSKHPTMTGDTFEVELLTSRKPQKVPPVARISSYKWLTTNQNQFYLVLELAPNIWHRWNRAFFLSNELLALRLSRSGGSSVVDLPLQRPLLVFYYTVIPAEKNKDMERFSLSKALERVRRRVHVYMPPRLCKNCALATRKNPVPSQSQDDLLEHSCSLHQWFVTLPELGWENWVIAPYEFFVDYCSGPCQPPIFSLINTTYNAVVRSIVANRTSKSMSLPSKTKNIPPPSCVPTLLKPINIIYNDNGTAVINKLENMVAQACGCS